MDFAKFRNYRHADPLKVRQVWDALGTVKGQRFVVPTDKLVKSLRKIFGIKDDQIRLLLDEIEGDGLIEKIDPSHGKTCPVGYQLPDFSLPFPRGKHDWYCYQCHKPGEVLRCSDCFRVYHVDCAQEASKLSTSNGKSVLSPTLHDGFLDDFNCAVCESRPKCEYSRKQIRKLLEFATHQLRKQPSWRTFLQIGYRNDINKNEYLVYKYTDLELLQRKIKDGRYAALEEFSMDVQLLVHDVCILHGPYSSQADEVRFLLRSINTELKEIQLCTDCYINAKTRLADWISKPCKPPHELIWACNRTPTGAGLFSDSVISQYYWPAKVLLERDDAYEIRFFGGTHERALVKKTHTRPFHIPADDVGVLRRNSVSGTLPGGCFERAWNEVSKLQANIDSGYYTHSSGESDLPPSDDEYSDEFYLASRRGASNPGTRPHRTLSPRSTSTSNNPKISRKRRTSSSSHQTSTSATPTNDTPSPLLPFPVSHLHSQTVSKARVSHIRALEGSMVTDHSDEKKNTAKLTVLPGTPGAAAISALAETKAAMAAAVGGSHRINSSFTSDLFTLTSQHDLSTTSKKPSTSYRRPANIGVRSKRGPGRPPKSLRKVPQISQPKRSTSLSGSLSSKSLSSLSSGSDSDDAISVNADSNASANSESNWHPKRNFSTVRNAKKKTSGRGKPRRQPKVSRRPKTTLVHQPAVDNTTNKWSEDGHQRLKALTTSPNHGCCQVSNSVSSRKKRSSTLSKRSRVAGRNSPSEKQIKRPLNPRSFDGSTLTEVHDEDDELTDRCCSPQIITEESLIKTSSASKHRHPVHSSPSHLYSNRKTVFSSSTQSMVLKPPSDKRGNQITPKPQVSPSSNGSSYSSPSTSDAESNCVFTDRHRLSLNKIRSPTRIKDHKLSGTSSTMLRRPPFAPPLCHSNSVSGSTMNIATTSARSSFNHLTKLFVPPGHTVFEGCGEFGSNMTISTHTSTLLDSSHSTPLYTSNLSPGPSNVASVNNLPSHTAAPMSQLPRSHLPPNKRAAAAATAAALSSTREGLDSSMLNQQSSPRGALINDTLQPTARKLVHKGIQTAVFPCPDCEESEARRLTEIAQHKRELHDLEQRLTTQMQEEKAMAIQAALDQAQASMRETIEREQKLAIEAAEARFAEVLVQTKRRQWCRNCLSEAIYHCCWNTSYCSIPCQQEHWQNEHKRQCRRKR